MSTAIKKNNALDMTQGSILKSMLLFAFPILIGNLFQQGYNLADTAVVGNFLGDDAIAAVGAAGPVYSLVLSFANGITNGFSVIVARYFGAHDSRKMAKAISLSYLLTFIISIILTVLALSFLDPLLRFLKTPTEIFNDTKAYLTIIIGCCIVTMFYNMFAGLFRAIGNSRMPLYFLIAATIINIVLDIVFVRFFNLGVPGVAYATAIAQISSVILCIIYISKKFRLLRFEKQHFSLDFRMINDLFFTGFSMGLMLAVVSVGSVALQNAVNSFGRETITAHAAARKFDELFMLPLSTVSMVSSTFASQNYGAKKMDRVKKGITTGILIAMGWSVFAFIFAYNFSEPIVRLLTGSENDFIISTAVRYITINTLFFAVLSILLILRSSLQGIGRKIVPIFASVIELIAKFAMTIYIAPRLGYIGVCFLEPAIWTVCALVVLIDFIVFIRKCMRKFDSEDNHAESDVQPAEQL